MKTHIIYLIIWLAAQSCQPQGPTIITGTIKPGNYKHYEFVLYDGKDFTPIPLDSSATRFCVKIPSDSIHFIDIKATVGSDEEKWIYSTTLYLSPGRKIDMQIQLEPRKAKTVILSQDPDNRAIQEYLAYYHEQQYRLWENTPQPRNAESFLTNYLVHPDKIIRQYKLTEAVQKYLTIGAYLHYHEFISNLQFIYSQRPGYQLPEGLTEKTVSPETILDDRIALQFDNITYVVNDWLKKKATTPEEQIQVLQNSFKDPAIIQEMTSSIAQNYVYNYHYSDDFPQSLSRLKAMTANLPDKGEKLIREFNNKKYTVPGAYLPTAKIADEQGKIYSLSDFKGKYLYIDFWASWCGPCCAEVPYLQKLEKQITNPNLRFLSISLDTDKEAWKKKMSKLNMKDNQFIAVGEELATTLNISGIPHFMLYDKEGKLMQYKAARPSDGKSLKDLLNELK